MKKTNTFAWIIALSLGLGTFSYSNMMRDDTPKGGNRPHQMEMTMEEEIIEMEIICPKEEIEK